MSFQTFTGLEYLKIDIANNFGHDKDDWNDRLSWFETNEAILESLVSIAEEPALFYAGVQAYFKAKAGKVSGYPISLDATASGIQILAAITGDRKAAQLCNIIDCGHRADAYTGIYMHMKEVLGDKGQIERKSTKQAIMTAFYSSTAIPKQVFGEGEMLATFYESMEEMAPGAWEVTKTMLDIWDPNAYANEWVMPDNFNVKIKVMGNITDYVSFLNEPYEVNYSVNKPIEGGRSLGANTVHSIDGMIVREMTRRCDFSIRVVDHVTELLQMGFAGKSTDRYHDKIVIDLAGHYNDCGFLSARVLPHLDKDNIGHIPAGALADLLNSLPAQPFKVLSVHDCFRCLPNYGNDLRRQYNQIMSELARSEILSFLVSQIVGRVVPVSKLDNDLHIDILDANYALS